MTSDEMVFGPGDIIADRYEIVEELGRGAYGVVFRAIQLGIGRPVAVKTLLPTTAVDSEEQQRFEREALLISRLNHPHIITLHDFGEYQGMLYMVVEYLEGKTLGDLLKEEGALEPEMARDLVYQMLDALQFAHGQGVVHRDLKPENIRLVPTRAMDGSEVVTLKILDFGIGKLLKGSSEAGMDRLTQGGVALGTPQYMSPENISGDPVTHHADLYAVGLLIYEMLVGDPTFTGTSPKEVMVAHLRDDPPELPPGEEFDPFRRAVQWALVKQPDERAPSALALREILEEDTPAPPVEVEVAPTPEAAPTSRGPLIGVLIAAAWVAVLLFLVILNREEPVTDEVVGETPIAETPAAVEESAEEVVEEIEVVEEVEEVEEPEEIEEESEEAIAEEPPLRPPREPREEVVEEPKTVILQVRSSPSSAQVRVNGVPLGTTPLSYEVDQGEVPLEFGFSLIGYRDTVVTVVPDASREVEARLERGRLELVP